MNKKFAEAIENHRTPMKIIFCEINTNENKAIPYNL